MADLLHVQVSYDEEAHVWWGESDDLPGLATEAPTLDGLMDRVLDVAPELLALNRPDLQAAAVEFHSIMQDFHRIRQLQTAR